MRVSSGLVLLLFPNFASQRKALQKIRIGFPSLAFSYMPFYVAQEKGLFKKYGIESEYIQMRTHDSGPGRDQRQHQLFDIGFKRHFGGGGRPTVGHRHQLLRHFTVGFGHTQGYQ